MKKIKGLTILVTLGLSLFSSSLVTHAETVDGHSTGEVQINGSIGKLDNTNPETTLPEGFDDWINVSLDTATLFHTTSASNHGEIESANYSIQNLSGRGVAVYISEMSGSPLYVDSLVINPIEVESLVDQPKAVNLLMDGELATGMQNSIWLKLANNQNQLEIGNSSQNYGNQVSFNYTGTTRNLPIDANSISYQENYVMTLRFESIAADGIAIGN